MLTLFFILTILSCMVFMIMIGFYIRNGIKEDRIAVQTLSAMDYFRSAKTSLIKMTFQKSAHQSYKS